MNISRDKILRVENLVKYFPIKSGRIFGTPSLVRAVDNISFEVSPGTTLGVVGESGSGKSTLGRTILMLTRATGGRVWFKGRNLFDTGPKELRALRKEMQFIFQDPFSSLNPRMKVQELLTEPLALHRVGNPKSREEAAQQMIEKVGLTSHAVSKFPHEFSGGQRQRICIARALILNPDFVLCDEAVSALDVSIQSQIINLLKGLQQDMGLTYMFISHDLSVIRHISDRVAVVYLGKLVEIGATAAVFNHPAHPYTRALLSASLSLDPGAQKKRILLKGEIPNAVNPPAGCRFHTRCPEKNERCRTVEPGLADTGDRHFAACHLFKQTERIPNENKNDADHCRGSHGGPVVLQQQSGRHLG